MARFKTANYLKPCLSLRHMTLDRDLDEHWKRVEKGFNAFMERYAPNGKFERFGPTHRCLTYRQFDQYVEGKMRPYISQHYRSHITACEDCSYMISELEKHLEGKSLKNRLIQSSRDFMDLFRSDKPV